MGIRGPGALPSRKTVGSTPADVQQYLVLPWNFVCLLRSFPDYFCFFHQYCTRRGIGDDRYQCLPQFCIEAVFRLWSGIRGAGCDRVDGQGGYDYTGEFGRQAALHHCGCICGGYGDDTARYFFTNYAGRAGLVAV